MNLESQRIAIAEACGWKRGQVEDYSFADSAKKLFRESWIDPRGIDFVKLPDYLNDLNAMHKAEKVLGKKTSAYIQELAELTKEVNMLPTLSTASQRAEAFLRTLGLWREDELFD